MIYTLTLNPALDRALEINRLDEDDVNRVVSERHYAAGKGIDVSRVIQELGGQSVAMGLVGGFDGYQVEGLLINAGVMTDFTMIGGETRTNIILKEISTGRQFMISAAGPEITAAEIGRLYRHLVDKSDIEYLVMSGSLPRGVSSNVYGQLIVAGLAKGAFVTLDADGTTLKQSLGYNPTLIKPNLHELERLTGHRPRTEEEMISACWELNSQGIRYVMLSRGRDGLLLSGRGRVIKAVGPKIKTESTVGAGDSTVAGFIWAHSRGQDLIDCLRLACAAGTATAQTEGTELCHREQVEALLDQIQVTEL